jgi:hypothetical protein
VARTAARTCASNEPGKRPTGRFLSLWKGRAETVGTTFSRLIEVEMNKGLLGR